MTTNHLYLSELLGKMVLAKLQELEKPKPKAEKLPKPIVQPAV